jgi:hypothetical protein
MQLHIESNANELLKRISDKGAAFKPDSPELLKALTEIGLRISSMAKLKATQQGIIDSGNLRARIGYEFFKDGNNNGIRIGVFGVRYAAMNEFGGRVTPGMIRAIFAVKKGKDYQPKGIIKNMYWKPRPFLRPAFISNRAYITDRIAEAFGVKK